MRYGWFAASGAAVGVGFYTYFASRGVPLILLAFALYFLVFHRMAFLRHWRGFALALVIATLLGVPLLVVLSQNPDAEARVAELAAPLYALRGGDPSMLVEYALRTLGMFAFTGDDEALYNIPYRPVFGVVGAAFFVIGVAVGLWRWREPAHAFLLLWFAAGLAPGALAVPAASLGHTILAQPAAYIFPALGVVWVGQKATAIKSLRSSWAARALLVLAAIYVGAEAARNLYDYFVVRPQDGFVRVLFHTDFMALARYLNDHPEVADIAIGAQIEERWNQAAFDIALERDDVRVRWYDPRTSRLNLFAEGYLAVPHYFFEDPATQYIPAQYRTVVAQTDAYRLYRMPALAEVAPGEDVAFAPGLTLRHASVYPYPGESVYVGTTWQVSAPLDLPARPLFAKPPAPGEPTTPRLEVFVHVLLPDGETPVHAAGGLGVDPYTLHPTDVFELRLTLPWDALAPGAYRVGVGLFDPWTGARYATEDGREMVIVGALEVPE
ncbi:MAG: hypothetical protein M5R40_11705 [Anaerolineae bacterium]|nr:hypothetical protein [Anaerolineae bacterium]